MNTKELLEIISRGEKIDVEFKRRRSSQDLNDTDLVRNVACLANGEGGVLLVGVEDNGTITGCAPFHKKPEETDPRRIEALIAHHTRPALVTTAEVHTVDGKDILCVSVPKVESPLATSKGVYQRRALRIDGTPECVAMDPSYLFSQYNSVNARDWAKLEAPGASLKDLDPDEFDLFRKMVRQQGGDHVLADLNNEEILRALGFFNDHADPVKNGAILLFGTPETILRWIPNHEIILQVMDGSDIKLNKRFTSPLLRSMMEIAERLDIYRKEEEINSGLLRIALPNLPERVTREAVANALVHRDYTALGTTRILLDSHALTVTNPGGLPRGVTLDTLLNASAPRSPALADAFKRAGLVDRAGRGIQVMYRILLSAGRDAPDYSATTDESVSVEIPVTGFDLEFARFVNTWQDTKGELEVLELRLLHIIHDEGRISLDEISELLNNTPTQIRRTLNHLADTSLVEVIGRGGSREFRLGSGFYDLVGRRPDFIRSQMMNEVRAEQLILAYIKEYGAITRAQAAETCGLTGQAAYRILRALNERELILKRGQTRNTHYVLP